MNEHLDSNQAARLQAALEAFRAARRAGTAPNVETFLAEHPDLPELRTALTADGTIASDASTVASDAPAAWHALELPRYTILGEIARGGQGVVYRARQHGTEQAVAIKVLARGSEIDGRRFEQEAQLLGRLQHPGIAAVLDSGTTPAGQHYYVMRFIDGHRLTTYLRERGADLETILRMLVRIARAIHYAHEQGVVHRDLKPSNILVDRHGEPQVLDFGLAKPLGREETFSASGQVMGTVAYMAPEQARGDVHRIDARSDVYALGVVLYQCLTGRLPFETTGSDLDLLRQIELDDPVPPTIRHAEAGDAAPIPIVPDEVETIVLKALNRDPQRRYASAAALADDIERYLRGEPIEARRDSALYRLSVQTRRTLARHRSLACVLVVPLVLAVCQWGITRVMRIDSLERAYYALVVGLAGGPAEDRFEFVRTIGITDEFDAEATAATLGIEGVSATDRTTNRLLLAELVRRLVAAEARAIVITYGFPRPAASDAVFADALHAARAAGVHVVVGTQSWAYGRVGPILSPNLRPYLSWGTSTTTLEPQLWQIDLAMLDGETGRVSPSLALRGIGAYLHPLAEMSLEWVGKRNELGLRFVRRNADAPELVVPVGTRRSLHVDHRIEADIDNPPFGLRAGDELLGTLLVNPRARLLREGGIDLNEVFATATADLHRLFHDRCVVVADCSSPRMVDLPDGQVSENLAVSFAIERGLSDLDARVPLQHGLGLTFVGALLGLLFGLRPAYGPWATALLGLGLVFGVCLLAAALGRVAWSPFMAAAGFLLTFALVVAVGRVRPLAAVSDHASGDHR